MAGGAEAGAGISMRDVGAGDEQRWRELWEGYIAFYEATVPEEITALTWRRMLETGSGVVGRVVVSGGLIEGFSISVLHPSTWTKGQRFSPSPI